MKLLFNTIMALENSAAIIALFAIRWLGSRYHWMTGPQQLATIGQVQILAFVCSFLALIMGLVSLPSLRSLQRHGCANLGAKKIWAYASLGTSAVLAFLSLLPTRHG